MGTITKTKETYTSAGTRVDYQPEQSFDSKRMRHYVDGQCSVLHCHHYATLFTQLACDAADFNGTDLLIEATAETMYPVLNSYFKKHGITDIPERIAIAEQYWAFVGMGTASFECMNNTGMVTMKHSHVDEGWLKKWGQRQERVNYIGEGYVKAAIGAIFNCDWNSVSVNETQSIVSGASLSRFEANW